VVTHQLQVERRTGKVRQSETDVLPLCHATNRRYTTLLLLLLLQPFNSLFSRTTWVSRNQKRKTSLDLNEARDDGVLGMQWHQLDHVQTICTSLQTDNHTNTPSLNFYRPDALSDAQPTVSKHERQETAPKQLCKILHKLTAQ